MSALPQGPLPSDYKTTVADLIREVGLASMTPSTLTRRLEARYNIDFAPHGAAVTAYVKEFMQTDEMRRELALIQQTVKASAGKGKRARSSSPKKEKKEKKEKKAKAEKAEKKPEDYPKGALSAYIIFAGDFREKNPEMPVKEQMTKAGAAWKQLSADEKKPFEERAAEDKKRHEREMEAYLAKGGKIFKRGAKGAKGAKAKKAKDPNAPKRALSAYFFFAADFRAKHPEMPVKEQMTKAGAAWREMSEEEKKPYDDKAAADKERYARECAAKGIKTSSGAAKSASKADSKDAASSSDDSSSDDSSSDDSDDE